MFTCPDKFDIYASINSKQEHPPPGKPPGKFFEVVKSPAPGQNFPAEAWKHLPPGSILEDLVSFSC